MRKPLLAALLVPLVLLVAGCGSVDGTPSELVHGAARRTIDAKTAKLDAQYEDGVRREGELELAGDRARIVEHGEFGYREYRYVDGAWFQLGGEIGPQGEDLGGKWIRHPRLGAPDDVLAEIQAAVRSLARATAIRDLGDRRYRARIGGETVTVRLDRRGRLRVLRRPGALYELGDFGTGVDVDPPAASDIYVGHD